MFDQTAKKYAQTGIIDIHCHLLPGLDDGARDMEETLWMLRSAQREGVTDIVATPHVNGGGQSAPPERIGRALEEVRAMARENHLTVRLYPGSEIYYFDGVTDYLKDGRICTLNHSRYVLVEFSPYVLFFDMQNAMDALLDAGYLPVLAHAERYICLRGTSEQIRYLKELGAMVQVNAAGVLGKNGRAAREAARQMLKEGLADYVGTDAHDCASRPPEFSKCKKALDKKYGKAYASRLIWENAQLILTAGAARERGYDGKEKDGCNGN